MPRYFVSKTKSIEQGRSRPDILGVLILFACIILSFIWVFNPSSVLQAGLGLLSLVIAILYFNRTLSLPLENRSPWGDALIVGSNFALVAFFSADFVLGRSIDLISPGIIIALLVSGILIKLLLLDRILMELFNSLWKMGKYIVAWGRNSVLNVLQLLLLLSAVLVSLFSAQLEPYYQEPLVISVYLVSAFMLISSYQLEDNRYSILRYIMRFAGIILLAVPTKFSLAMNIALKVLALTFVIWGFSLKRLGQYFLRFSRFIQKNPRLVTEIIFWVSALVLLFIPIPYSVAGYDIRFNWFLSGLFVVFAINARWIPISKTVYNYLKYNVVYFIAGMIADSVKWINQNKILALRILSFIAGIIVLIIGLLRWDMVQVGGGIALMLLAFAVNIIRMFISVYQFVSGLVRNGFAWVAEHKIGSFQMAMALSALLSYLLASSDTILGDLSLRVVLAEFFLVLALIPTLYDLLRYLLPRINVSRILFVMGVVFLIIPFNVDEQSIQLGSFILSAISFSLTGDFFVMRLLDTMLYAFSTIFHYLRIFARMIIPRVSRSMFQSFMAWVILFIGILYPSIGLFDSLPNPVLVRWSIIVLALVLWFSAYEKRRAWIKRRFASLYRRLGGLLRFVYRNIILLIFFSIALFFIILSFGLIFPSSVELSEQIFGAVMENGFVARLIGIFLLGIGILAIRETYNRRNVFQMEVKS